VLALWFALVILLGARRRGRGAAPVSRLCFFLLAGWMLLLTTSAGAQRYSFFLAATGWAAAGYGLSQLIERRSEVRGPKSPDPVPTSHPGPRTSDFNWRSWQSWLSASAWRARRRCDGSWAAEWGWRGAWGCCCSSLP